MKKVLIVDTDKCTGCRVCELVCSMAKQGEFNPGKSYIRVIRNKEMDFNMLALGVKCDFCNECVEWCPTKTLKFVTWEEAALIRKENKPEVFPAPILGVWT